MKTNRMTLMLTTLALLALTVTSVITPVFANGNGNGNGEYDSDLEVGRKGIPVGTVTIVLDGDELSVRYSVEGGCSLVETHLWVGDDLADLPKTKSGNPKIGHFPYANDHEDTVTDFTYVIPISEFSGRPLYIAAHAVVDCPCQGEETAWGQGCHATSFSDNPIFGRRWGYYIQIP